MNLSDSPPNPSQAPDRSTQFQATNTEPLWTVDEVAQYLKLEPETVRAMARAGKLPAFKIGKVWRFKKSALIKSLNSPQVV